MKKKYLILLLIFPLLAGKCVRERDDCHLSIKVINNSNNTVISSRTLHGEQCTMSGNILNPGEHFEYFPYRSCIELSLGQNSFYTYIIDPSNINSPNEYYDCDSIEFNNTILQTYILNLEELQANDFTISYP